MQVKDYCLVILIGYALICPWIQTTQNSTFLIGEIMDEHARVIDIDREPIELYKILKIENLAQSGCEAKHVIADGFVRVNGVVETRKRKKILSGDVVEFEGIKLRVRLKRKA